MFIQDVALVRRDGVDSALLSRSPAGARYTLES